MTLRHAVLSLSALSVLACTSAPPPRSPPAPPRAAPAPLALTPCTLPGVNRPAKCGTAHVLEDRASLRGRVVALKVVVVPAAQSPALPDPVVIVTGGPGEAATEEVPVVADFVKTSATRDFVFVDQRGMGRDSPLRCKLIDGADVGGLPSGELSEAKLRACLAKMDADPALYTTAIAADDLDEVLTSLGYTRANVLGFSYGTFATQTLAHAHPERVRTLILDGVAPPEEGFVLGFAPSSQVALEQTFAECAADASCHAMYPDPKGELARAFVRLDTRPERLLADGPDGKKYPVTLDHNSFAMALRNPLYEAPARGRALAMIHEVAEGRFDNLAVPLLLTALGLGDELSVGAYLSIACAESVRGVTIADAERTSAGTFLGTARAAPILNACKFWPTGSVPPWLHKPVTGDVPALLFGGTVDPATPLVGLEEVKSKLKNAQAVVVPGAGHDVGGACMDQIVAAFLDRPLAKVDTGCVKPIVTHFARPPIKVAAVALDRCKGRFAIEPKFVLTVLREGDELTVQATGQGKLHLDAESETRFRIREIEATLDFEMGADGRAKRLVLHQGTRDSPGDRVE